MPTTAPRRLSGRFRQPRTAGTPAGPVSRRGMAQPCPQPRGSRNQNEPPTASPPRKGRSPRLRLTGFGLELFASQEGQSVIKQSLITALRRWHTVRHCPGTAAERFQRGGCTVPRHAHRTRTGRKTRGYVLRASVSALPGSAHPGLETYYTTSAFVILDDGVTGEQIESPDRRCSGMPGLGAANDINTAPHDQTSVKPPGRQHSNAAQREPDGVVAFMSVSATRRFLFSNPRGQALGGRDGGLAEGRVSEPRRGAVSGAADEAIVLVPAPPTPGSRAGASVPDEYQAAPAGTVRAPAAVMARALARNAARA